ncbi:MAG: DUF3108 domain-containing protein [Marinilabiliales bacterium]|nr:MAG: DUF3108 domain-containing protein [Marinilabiliales bacterium]
MYIRILILVIPAILVCNASRGQTSGSDPVYMAGESLRYQIYYGPVTGGEVTMTLTPAKFGEREVLHAVALGYTTGLANRIFRIYDIYESYMDPATGLPVKSIRNISEGSYRFYNEVLYDRDSNTVYTLMSGRNEAPPGVMDMVSAIYKLRDTMSVAALSPGDVLEMNTWFSDRLYPVYIRYSGPETVRTRMGQFDALKFFPVSEPGRVFKGDDDITVWFSDDGNFVPLRVRLNMLVGAVRMDLIEAEGLRRELQPMK